MKETINLTPDLWVTSTEAAKLAGRTQRAVQKLAQDGMLQWKPAGRKSHPNARLYNVEDLQRLAPTAPKPAPTRSHHKKPETTALTTSFKPTQAERALDTVSIVGQLIAGHKTALENVVTSILESNREQMAVIMNAYKAEADANRERMKADREDNRERWEAERKDANDRWEAERQDRQERLQLRRQLPAAAKHSTRKARS